MQQNTEAPRVDHPDAIPAATGLDEASATFGSWAVSIALHLVLALVFSFVVFLSAQQKEAPIFCPTRIDPPEEPPQREASQILELSPTATIDTAAPSLKDPMLTMEMVEPQDCQTEDDLPDQVDTARGREEALSDAEQGGMGLFSTIGAGTGAKGLKVARTGAGKHTRLRKYGGGRGTMNAVQAALRWFVRHQSPNGLWSVDSYGQNCDLPGPKCEPGRNGHGGNADLATTGYALLCFLGDGHDHRTPGPFKKTVQRGLDWLLANQGGDGSLGPRNYEHAIATMALCEALAMTLDPALRVPCERAVKVILARQTRLADGQALPTDPAYSHDGLGWDYISPNPGRNDSSVTGWNVMALKSAKVAGIVEAEAGLAGAERWLTSAWKAANPGLDPKTIDKYTSQSVFPYTWNPTGNAAAGTHLACVGLVVGVFLGHQAGDPMLESLANTVMKTNLPTAYPLNTYLLYYNTIGIFQMGGERWTAWNQPMSRVLVQAQRQGGDCFAGSWDWQGTQFPGNEVGRLVSTAYCCLSLEIYYRNQRLFEHP